MNAADLMLKDLQAGKAVKTDNITCLRFGSNQIPDLARKLRNKGYPVQSNYARVKKGNGTVTRVAVYTLTTTKQRG